MEAGMEVQAIEATGLVKHFGETRAVDGLDLSVPAGAVYGVLGPNGAGKTTAIRMLATLLEPTAGHARVFGHDVVTDAEQVRSLVSLTGQFASVDEDLTGAENLILLARLWGYGRAAARTAPRSCWRPSGWRTQPVDRSRPTPAGCGDASTSPPP
jgi:ABC-2 type transport system ATP-binding protein